MPVPPFPRIRSLTPREIPSCAGLCVIRYEFHCFIHMTTRMTLANPGVYLVEQIRKSGPSKRKRKTER